MRRWFAGLVSLGMLAGCSFGSDEEDGTIAVMGLTSFDACADVLDHLKAEGRDRMGPYGFGTGNDMLYSSPGFAVEDSAEALASAPQAGDSAGGSGGSAAPPARAPRPPPHPPAAPRRARARRPPAGRARGPGEPGTGEPRADEPGGFV